MSLFSMTVTMTFVSRVRSATSKDAQYWSGSNVKLLSQRDIERIVIMRCSIEPLVFGAEFIVRMWAGKGIEPTPDILLRFQLLGIV